MADMKWTERQEQAITASGRTLLVSAAAGSGKTATLTERIIRRLCDPDGTDITRLVIVTFTKAAASELKEKIHRAVSARLAEDPGNKKMLRQLMMLPSARISTIHSFCYDIIRRYAAELGLPTGIRIGDESECDLLSRRVMEELVTERYDSCDMYAEDEEDGEDTEKVNLFASLAETLEDPRKEQTLPDFFLSLYHKLCSCPEGSAAVTRAADAFADAAGAGKDFLGTVYGKELKDRIAECLNGYCGYLHVVVEDFEERGLDEKGKEHPYLAGAKRDFEICRAILNALDTSYEDAKNAIEEAEQEKFGSMKKEEKAADESAQTAETIHKRIKELLVQLKKQNFLYDSFEIEDMAGKTETLSRVLSELLREFEERYRRAKTDAGIIDYNDLEYYAHRLLLKDGQPTATARLIAQGIDEIYIDEYQDVNRVQDEIFRAVSRGNNLFMVGDVKQSIYRFRGGDPDIFTEYREKFPEYKGENDPAERAETVFMQENFRCDKTVVDFTNQLFVCLFGEGGGSFRYRVGDALNYGKNGGIVSPNEVMPRLCLCEPVSGEEGTPPENAEASFVADEIARLLTSGKKNNGDPIEPGDIAILLRSDETSAPAFLYELSRRGIPASGSQKTSPFDAPEMRLILCLLDSIDNPHRDISLAGVLLSFIYGFTPDELALIATEEKNTVSFYEGLRNYTQTHDFEKGKTFLSRSERYRMLSERMPVDRFLRLLYDECRIVETLCAEAGDALSRQRIKENCMLFYEYARRYEKGLYRGLSSFLSYIRDLIEKGKAKDTGGGARADAVQVMTIHRSKGLEYPVCFLSATHRRFNDKSTQSNLLFDPSLGIGMKLLYGKGYVRVDTPFRDAVAEYIRSKDREEELRLLYVALTRARERLYITASCGCQSEKGARNKYDAVIEAADKSLCVFSPYEIRRCTGFLPAILLAIKKNEIRVAPERIVVRDDPVPYRKKAAEHAAAEITESSEELLRVLKERMESHYRYEKMTTVPAKLAVSKLYPAVLDEGNTDVADTLEKEEIRLKEAPAFMTGDTQPTAAEKGTATHLVMQFADFERMGLCGVEAEIRRLLDAGYIDERTAEIARRDEIDRFVRSDFYRRIRGAKKLWREFRFNLPLDAAEFTEDASLQKELENEKLLVQGVIDGFFLEGDKLILFDYKTDHLTKEEMADPEKARAMLEERHGQQLDYYRRALSRLFGREVDETYIYSMPLGRELRIGENSGKDK